MQQRLKERSTHERSYCSSVATVLPLAADTVRAGAEAYYYSVYSTTSFAFSPSITREQGGFRTISVLIYF